MIIHVEWMTQSRNGSTLLDVLMSSNVQVDGETIDISREKCEMEGLYLKIIFELPTLGLRF